MALLEPETHAPQPGELIYPVPEAWARRAQLGRAGYQAMYDASRRDPEGFWGEQAARLNWVKRPTLIKNVSFAEDDFRIRWFEDGVLNVAHNCIDRHLPQRRNQVAIIWEGDEPGQDRKITYQDLFHAVCRMANVLKKHGVEKGDRVTIYLPMIPEAAYAMLSTLR